MLCPRSVHNVSTRGPFGVTHIGSIHCPSRVTFLVHLGSNWGMLRHMLCPCCVHLGSIWGPILGPYCVHLVSIFGPFWVHFAYCLKGFNQYSNKNRYLDKNQYLHKNQ